MNRSLLALVVAAATLAGPLAALAQEQPAADQPVAGEPIPEERFELARQVVRLSGSGRTFDELLPNIATNAKSAFIRSNPQMQLGIIDVVDRVALDLVRRRPELDLELARVWASGFDEAQLQELIDFYSTETGKKFANIHPNILAAQLAAAEAWGRSISAELSQRVAEELRTINAAEQQSMTGADAPAEATPAAPAAPAAEQPAQ